MKVPVYIGNVAVTIHGESRFYLIRAANTERVLYDCEWAFNADGILPHAPARFLAMKPANFAARVGWPT